MKLYVGNMPYSITEEELESLFGEYGAITSVNIIKDRDTGNSKGFGFVEMQNKSDAENVISEFDGKDLKGRNLKVSEAKPMNSRPREQRRSW